MTTKNGEKETGGSGGEIAAPSFRPSRGFVDCFIDDDGWLLDGFRRVAGDGDVVMGPGGAQGNDIPVAVHGYTEKRALFSICLTFGCVFYGLRSEINEYSTRQ